MTTNSGPYEGEIDPLTNEPLVDTDVVVICQDCGSYQRKSSWAQDQRCSSQGCGGISFVDVEGGQFRSSVSEVTTHEGKMPESVTESLGVTPSALESEGQSPDSPPRRRVQILPSELPRARVITITSSEIDTARSTPLIDPVRLERAEGVTEDDARDPQTDPREQGSTRKHDRSRVTGVGWSTSVLDSARVLVVGAGAIGNEVLKNLALLGIGNICVVDLDTVDASNLTRAILFSEKDIGRPKVEVVAAKIREIERSTRLQIYEEKFQPLLGIGAFRRFDIVFACVDNLQARIDLAKACLATRTPMLEGSVLGLDGQASVTLGPDTACFDCSLSSDARKTAGNTHSCHGIVYGEPSRPSMPFTPTISSVVAGVMTQWGMQVLHGLFDLTQAKRFRFTAGDGESSIQTIRPSSECPTHNYTECIVDEQIITRPDWSLETSVASVLESVREYPAFSHGKLELPIPFELAVGLTCKSCGHSSSIRRKAGEILLREALCPNRCSLSEPMNPEYVHSICLEEELSRSSLRDLTFRPLDYIWVKNGDSGESLCFEIGGEIDSVFGELSYGEPKDVTATLTHESADG